MYNNTIPLYLLCESSLHAGSVNDLGDIDLPIQREKHTGFPKVESSSLKGALREAFEAKVPGRYDFSGLDSPAVQLHRVFGLDADDLGKTQEEALRKALKGESKKDHDDYASAIGFADARLLLFPVRSLKGIFAWITCPRVLKKFKHELNTICSPKIDVDWDIPRQNTTTSSCTLFLDQAEKDRMQLDEYIFQGFDATKRYCDDLAKWLVDNVFKNAPEYWQEKAKNDIVVLSNEDFTNFVNYATEVVTRIKINGQTGTVEDGQLFSEEYLPPESILYSLAMFSKEFRVGEGLSAEKVAKFFAQYKPEYFQLGGNATLGKGIINLHFELPKPTANE